jgi:hypothetical protein
MSWCGAGAALDSWVPPSMMPRLIAGTGLAQEKKTKSKTKNQKKANHKTQTETPQTSVRFPIISRISRFSPKKKKWPDVLV